MWRAGRGLECGGDELRPWKAGRGAAIAIERFARDEDVGGFAEDSALGLGSPGSNASGCGERHHDGGGGDTAAARDRRAGDFAYALGERVLRLGGPVAADREWPRGEVSLQQRFGVLTADAGTARDHLGIAGHFLVNAHGVCADMDQRVEPEEAAHESHDRVDAGVGTVDMDLLVREDQLALVMAEAADEIVGRDNARVAEADDGGACQPKIGVTQEGALAANEQQGEGYGAGEPGGRDGNGLPGCGCVSLHVG